jgi:predicted O-methyltransferase YrrM
VKQSVRSVLWALYRPLIGLLARLVKLGWRLGRPWSLYERQGVLPIPVHYYHPYPTGNELEQGAFWTEPSELLGIELELPAALELLEELGRRFSAECDWPEHSSDPHVYHASNGSFGLASAAVAHAMVRRFAPGRIIEVGSGYSTHVLGAALERNAAERGGSPELISIEPHPPEILRTAIPRLSERIEKRVELVESDLFRRLKRNDFLFIDSSHVIRDGGDVLFLYLRVLPSLAPGVVVHIHDIHLPDPYPRSYFEDDRYVWNEQQLLQAFLCHNDAYRVLLPCWLVHREHDDLFRRAFPRYDPRRHRPGSSFWMQRRD